MKIIEIIVEDTSKKLPKSTREAIPHAKQFVDIDQYYGMYRFGVAMAAAPDGETPKEGPAKDVPAVWMYSKGEEDIVKKAQKNQGIKGKTLVSSGPSEEVPSTNVTSPVAAPKRNKYGV